MVLTETYSQMSSADQREIVLSGSGGEIGLARCLKQEHLPVRHSTTLTQSGNHRRLSLLYLEHWNFKNLNDFPAVLLN